MTANIADLRIIDGDVAIVEKPKTKRPHQAKDVNEAIDLLVECSLVEYQGYRKTIAKEWEWQVSVLDAEVERRRKAKAQARKAKANGPAPRIDIDGATLLDDIYEFLGRFVAYPSEDAHVAHVLWVAHAHMMAAWESTPRIAFLSPEPGSGKTRALEVSELLVPRPVLALSVSSSYLFRKISDEAGTPTVLYDEVDTVWGPHAKNENEEIRGLLNAGHRRGGISGRCVIVGKAVETVDFPAYCAVALAGLGDLPDTILTRSVIVRMRRRAPTERVEPFRRRDAEAAGTALRDQMAGWTAGVMDAAAALRPKMPPGIEDRNADVWEALLAVADLAGGSWPERARVSAVSLVSLSMTREASLGVRLLADLRTVFSGMKEMFTTSILQELLGLEDAPWGDLKGRPLDSRGLSWRLGKFGIAPKQVRVGALTNKGYKSDDLHDAWQRYLPGLPSLSCAHPPERETRETGETNPPPPVLAAPPVSLVSDVSLSGVRAHEREHRGQNGERDYNTDPLGDDEFDVPAPLDPDDDPFKIPPFLDRSNRP